MGFQVQDFQPLRDPTTITPPGKSHLIKVFQIQASDGSGEVVKAVIPASASIYAVRFFGNDAGGSSDEVDVTLRNNSGDISTGNVDLETNGTTSAFVQMTNLPNIQPIPNQGDIKVITESTITSGGPWKFAIEYVA